MRAVDTNVLIRFFIDDGSNQAAAARHIFDTSLERGEPLLIVPHVLCELVWVLSTSFNQRRAEVGSILQRILAARVFVFEREHLILGALESYLHGRADFSDYLIGEIASASGCRDTVTFDRALKGARGFALL